MEKLFWPSKLSKDTYNASLIAEFYSGTSIWRSPKLTSGVVQELKGSDLGLLKSKSRIACFWFWKNY